MSTRVLVTGGASGLGHAIAGRFAAAGARVLITDVNSPTAPPTGDVSFHRLDVRSEAGWDEVLDWCEKNWGGVDVLVNNAGVAASGRIERLQLSDWDWILDINLKGAVLGCQTFVPMFKQQGHGHIVNIASMAGLFNPPGMVSYNVSKAAVVALSETLRLELAPYGVRTTVVCPSFVPTNLAASLRGPDTVLAEAAKKLISHGKISAPQVADQVYAAVAARKFLVVTHPEARKAMRIKRFWPALVDREQSKMWRRTLAKLEAQDRDESGRAG